MLENIDVPRDRQCNDLAVAPAIALHLDYLMCWLGSVAWNLEVVVNDAFSWFQPNLIIAREALRLWRYLHV